MTRLATRKRVRAPRIAQTARAENIPARYLVDEQGKRVAVVLDLAEYRRLKADAARAPQPRMPENERARLVALARQAEGSWQPTEPHGTAVEIVRRLRDELK